MSIFTKIPNTFFKLKLTSSIVISFVSALIITILSISMVGQISVSAISNEISEDPVVLAQQYLDNSQNSVSFTKSKSLESVIQYLKAKNFNPSNVVAYSTIEIDNQFLDIPFSLDLSQDLSTNQKNFDDSKNNLLSTIKVSKQDKPDSQAPTEIPLGDVTLNVKQAQIISDQKLDEAKKSQLKVKINKISFTAKSNNPEIQNFEKSDKKVEIKSKSALNKTAKTDDILNLKAVNDGDIENVSVKKPTEEEKIKALDEAQKTKEGIARKENERFIGETIVKPLKEKAAKEQVIAQKQKAREVKKLIDEGKQDEIKIEDVYALGEESKGLGLEIKVPEKQEQGGAKIELDLNKAKAYKLEKTVGLFERILNFGSVEASAFSPNYNNTYMYHAKPNTHYGTVLDLYGANTSNGATIGFWYNNNNNGWNQKFDLYSDDTIRVGGKCLDMSDYGKINRGENANGVKIHLWDCNGGWAQKWVYDTEGLLRLKGSNSYCLDARNGSANSTTYLYTCGSPTSTEAFRASQYEMIIYSRRGGSGSVSPVGHTFVGFVKWNDYNYMSCLDTYTLWNDLDTTLGLGCHDSTNRGSWDNVYVNKSGDFNEGLNLTQNYSNPTYLTYWKKNILQWQYNDMMSSGWKPQDGNSTYSFAALGNNCTTYSYYLWNKYVSNSDLKIYWPEPNYLYYLLKDTKIYNY